MSLTLAREALYTHIHPEGPAKMAYYFKTGEGDYAAHDQFIGVTRGKVRLVAHRFAMLADKAIKELLYSPIHEERLLALLIWVVQFKKASPKERTRIYKEYITHIDQVNNWDLVDFSSPQVIGAHLFKGDRSILHTMVTSVSLWKRRIAIVATQGFIKEKDCTTSLTLAEKLLNDSEDLIHKAVGWTLREVGKQSITDLTAFLDRYASTMPRTMLRYALERLAPTTRKHYMQLTA